MAARLHRTPKTALLMIGVNLLADAACDACGPRSQRQEPMEYNGSESLMSSGESRRVCAQRRQADAQVLPLSGVRVVGFEQLIAGPAGTQIMAELGADVIKVERPSGDSSRGSSGAAGPMFRAYNRGKRSVALDLKTEEGQAAAQRLMSWADVMVTNLRPTVMQEWGLGPDDCCERNPRLVYVGVSGYGTRGPSRDRQALDIALQAESGMMFVTGEADGDPQRVGFALVDAASGMAVALAAMTGLLERERTGRGRHVEVPMLQVAMHLQAVGLAGTAVTGRQPVRKGNGQAVVAPAADVIATRDGQIVISAYEPAHWRRLCSVIGRPELADDDRFSSNERRVRNRPELLAILSSSLGGHDTSECLKLLAGAGVVAGAIRGYREVLASDDVLASDALVPYLDEDGQDHVAVGLPFSSAGWDQRTPARLPRVDQHGSEIMTMLNFQGEDAHER